MRRSRKGAEYFCFFIVFPFLPNRARVLVNGWNVVWFPGSTSAMYVLWIYTSENTKLQAVIETILNHFGPSPVAVSSSFCHFLFSRVRYCRLRWQKFPPLQVQSEAYEHVQRCGFLKVQEHAGGWSLIPWRRTTRRLYYPGTTEGEALLAHQPGWEQLSLLVHMLVWQGLP